MLSFVNSLLLICDFCRPLKDALFCNPQTSTSDMRDSLNMCADRILKLSNDFLANYVEPLQLPDLHSDFNYSIFTTHYGSVDLTEGMVQNLSTLGRTKDIIFATSNKKTLVTFSFAFSALMFSYEYSAKMIGFAPTGRIHTNVRNFEMELKFTFDHQSFCTFLEDFKILDSRQIEFEFFGNFIINWLLKVLSDLLSIFFKNDILENLELVIKDAIEMTLNEVNQVIEEYTKPTFFQNLLQKIGDKIKNFDT